VGVAQVGEDCNRVVLSTVFGPEKKTNMVPGIFGEVLARRKEKPFRVQHTRSPRT